MVKSTQIYQARATECEAAAAVTDNPKLRATYIEAANRWRDLIRKLEHMDRDPLDP